MIDKGTLAVAARFKDRVRAALKEPVEVVLFGSYARGEQTRGSDLDLLVTVRNLDRKARDVIFEIAWEIGFEAGIIISAIPAGRNERERLKGSPFFKAVEREGVGI